MIVRGYWGLVLIPSLTACAGTAERAAVKDSSRDRGEYATQVVSRPVQASTDRPRREDGTREDGRSSSLQKYIATAMEQNPALRGAFERWEASVHRISQSRSLPDPEISFGYFLQSVETRVGPQRARLSLRQSFPWPTRLTAGADSASAGSRALQRQVDALALAIKQQVEAAYWKLWLVRQTRRIHRSQLVVVRSLSESVLARVATGSTTLADQQQVDLAAARLEDMLRSMDEAEATAVAELHMAMGVAAPADPATEVEPDQPLLPTENKEALLSSVKAHPLIESYGEMAHSSDEMARAQNAARYPSFSLGADWIIVGEARMAGVEDSGKDAVMVGAGMTVPLWQGIRSDSVSAARADAHAHRAEREAAEDRAVAEFEASHSAVRDAARRVVLYRTTLVPQADSAYSSVLGAYATGRGTVAQTLLAQRDLLELRAGLEQARADYAMAWARLERVVGRPIVGKRVVDLSELKKK